MGGLFNREYVTGPIVGSSRAAISVSLANTGDTDTTAAAIIRPAPVLTDGFTVPAGSVFTVELSVEGGGAYQVWVSVLLQSDRVVPTVTITIDSSTQVYLPGDLVGFDFVTGARLW